MSLSSEESKLHRAKTIWKHITKFPEKYYQGLYGIRTPIEGTECNTPMCIFGWLRQLFPKDYKHALAESTLLTSKKAVNDYFHRGETVVTTVNELIIREVAQALLPEVLIPHLLISSSTNNIRFILHGLFPEVSIKDTDTELDMFTGTTYTNLTSYISQDQLQRLEYVRDTYIDNQPQKNLDF